MEHYDPKGLFDPELNRLAAEIADAVDPRTITRYASGEHLTNLRSNTMNESSLTEGEAVADTDKEQLTVRQFINKLEGFLDETLQSDSRGNVFMSENGDGACLNVLIGAAFANASSEVNQVNVIISPTDRGFLGSEGVSMDDSEYTDDPALRTEDYEDGDDEFWDGDDEDDDDFSAFDEAMELL